ncbi:uncharacterized protein Tco025E_05879 [Trypanosoma conorhini]|uniref:Uncharacterized protein n=1 Tax=Trypanosoma conorhini TaxID=83891 RepID=A0A3R7NZN8_9TRYP|nr:uncharacterized protein Tco025E_05879 [Trypanosoma conorhini]RNF14622.1 hypothetical protein Tco025E_05879 [Trypanosoma conorhini]
MCRRQRSESAVARQHRGPDFVLVGVPMLQSPEGSSSDDDDDDNDDARRPENVPAAAVQRQPHPPNRPQRMQHKRAQPPQDGVPCGRHTEAVKVREAAVTPLGHRNYAQDERETADSSVGASSLYRAESSVELATKPSLFATSVGRSTFTSARSEGRGMPSAWLRPAPMAPEEHDSEGDTVDVSTGPDEAEQSLQNRFLNYLRGRSHLLAPKSVVDLGSFCTHAGSAPGGGNPLQYPADQLNNGGSLFLYSTGTERHKSLASAVPRADILLGSFLQTSGFYGLARRAMESPGTRPNGPVGVLSDQWGIDSYTVLPQVGSPKVLGEWVPARVPEVKYGRRNGRLPEVAPASRTVAVAQPAKRWRRVPQRPERRVSPAYAWGDGFAEDGPFPLNISSPLGEARCSPELFSLREPVVATPFVCACEAEYPMYRTEATSPRGVPCRRRLLAP